MSEKMSVQLFKDGSDLHVVLKGVNASLEDAVINMLLPLIKNEVKEVPGLLPLSEPEIQEPDVSNLDEVVVNTNEKPLFLSGENSDEINDDIEKNISHNTIDETEEKKNDKEVCVNETKEIDTVESFFTKLNDKKYFNELKTYYQSEKKQIERLVVNNFSLKDLLRKIYSVCPSVIDDAYSNDKADNLKSFVDNLTDIRMRKLIRQSLVSYFN